MKCQCVVYDWVAEGFAPCKNEATGSRLVKSAATGLQWMVKSCSEHAVVGTQDQHAGRAAFDRLS